jgi:hypothetical protein
MEMRSLSLCVEATGSCTTQVIESERRTARTPALCQRPQQQGIRGSVASRDQGPWETSTEVLEKSES